MILTAVVIAVLVHLAIGALVSYNNRKLYSYSGLLGYPVIGPIYYFYKILLSVFSTEDIRQYVNDLYKKYGKDGICFHYAFHWKRLVLLSSPDIIKQLAFHPGLKDKMYFGYDSFNAYMTGPFTRPYTDDQWKITRKEYTMALKKSRIENNYYNVFLEASNKLVEIMLASRHRIEIDKTSLSIVMSSTMKTILELDNSMAFDPVIAEYMHKLKVIGGAVVGNPLLSEIILPFFRWNDEIVIRKVGILRRMALREVYKLMGSLKLRKSSESEETYKPLTLSVALRTEKGDQFEKKLITDLQEVVIVSTHTTAATLTSVISTLAVLPEIQEKAWKEQYEIFGDDDREPTQADLDRMTYLERVIKEVLRYGGPPFVGKQAIEDIEINGVIIPKDTAVLFLLDYMRHDPTFWKNPEVFDPDRFLDETEDMKYYYTPFGVGIRNCPGGVYAMIFIKFCVSKMLRKIIVSPVDKNFKFKDLIFAAYILMELKNPPLLQAKERSF